MDESWVLERKAVLKWDICTSWDITVCAADSLEAWEHETKCHGRTVK